MKDASRIKHSRKLILQPKTLLVGYALLDVVWTYLSTSHNQTEAILEASAIGSDIDFMYSPLQLTVLGPGILLLASTSLWLSRPWSYVVAIAASAWLLYRGIVKWGAIASALNPEVSRWSNSVLKWWWTYGSAGWDFPRYLLGALIIVGAMGALVRDRATRV